MEFTTNNMLNKQIEKVLKSRQTAFHHGYYYLNSRRSISMINGSLNESLHHEAESLWLGEEGRAERWRSGRDVGMHPAALAPASPPPSRLLPFFRPTSVTFLLHAGPWLGGPRDEAHRVPAPRQRGRAMQCGHHCNGGGGGCQEVVRTRMWFQTDLMGRGA